MKNSSRSIVTIVLRTQPPPYPASTMACVAHTMYVAVAAAPMLGEAANANATERRNCGQPLQDYAQEVTNETKS